MVVSTVVTGSGTSLGVSTAKTLLGGAAVILPAWARTVLAVVPVSVPDASVAAQPLNTQIDVESNDVSITPYQVLCAPTGATLQGTIAAALTPKAEKWPMNLPVSGGEQISVYGTDLFAYATTAPYAMAALVVSSEPANRYGPQKHSKTGTITSLGTTANSDVAGTRYNFSGSRHITELFGIVNNIIVAAADGMLGYIKYTSNEFLGIADARLVVNPVAPGVSTSFGTLVDGVSRMPVDIPTAPGQVNVQDYANLGLIAASAGDFISGVMYD